MASPECAAYFNRIQTGTLVIIDILIYVGKAMSSQARVMTQAHANSHS